MFFCTCIIFQDQRHKGGKKSMRPSPLILKKPESALFNPLFSFGPVLMYFFVTTVTGMFRRNF